MRAVISPTSPRETASGLQRMSVRSIAIGARYGAQVARSSFLAADNDRERPITQKCRIGTWLRSWRTVRLRRSRIAKRPEARMQMRRSCLATSVSAVTRSLRSSSAMAPGARGDRGTQCRGRRCSLRTILPRSIAVDRLWLVPFWVALAVRAGLRNCGVATTLQWPNDLLLRRSQARRHSLPVARDGGNGTRRLRCWDQRAPPAGAAAVIEPAPAFCDEVALVDRAALLVAILRTYDATLATLDDAAGIRREWEAAAEIPGRRYRIAKDNAREPFEAIAQSLDEGGGLRVLRDDGASERVEMADARVLR